MIKDLMECCDLCTLITHDQDGGETVECTDDNCTCHIKEEIAIALSAKEE